MAQFVLDDPAMGMALWLLLALIVLLGVVALIAVSKPVFARMAMRNATRRPSQTTMVVLGLMVGTAILSAAFVASDSLEYMIVEEVYTGEDLVDEMVVATGQGTFDHSVYEGLVADEGVDDITDGLSPVMLLTGTSINNVAEGQTEANVNLHGVDFGIDSAFGTFETLDGIEVDGTALEAYEAIVSHTLAKDARIDEGDKIMIFYLPPGPASASSGHQDGGPGGEDPLGAGPDIHYTVLTVRYVVRDEGKANYQGGKNVFVTLGTIQEMFEAPGAINAIKVSNDGGVVDGMDLTDDAVEELEAALGSAAPTAGLTAEMFEVSAVKQDSVEMAKSSAKGMSDFLLIASAFTVIAGTLLIINIFTMLAEERKKELGISRAIGMRRSSLVRTFTFEGVLYSLIAAGLGTLVGLGIGYLLISGMMSAVSDLEGVPFYFKNSSLLIAFCVGTFITIVTVTYSSWKVSNLNIVRSIRAMEEPKVRGEGLKGVIRGGVFLAVGLIITYQGFAPGGSVVLMALGPNLAIIGIGLSIKRWVPQEMANTFIGVGALLYSTWGLFNLEAGDTEGMLAIVVVGVMLVGGSVLALVSNSRPIMRGVGWLLSRTPRGKAVGSPAIAHPLNRGFRTGMTIAMFGLIIFIVVLFSIFFTIFAPDVGDEKGGYDLFATSSVPVSDITNVTITGSGMEGPAIDYTTLNASIERIGSMAEMFFWNNLAVNGEEMIAHGPPGSSIFGIDASFASHTEYSLSKRSDAYSTDREAWLALRDDPNLCIIDTATATDSIPVNIGDVISLPDEVEGKRNYTVIGIVDELLLSGIFVQQEGMLADFPHIRGSTLFLLTVKEGENIGEVAKDLESDLSPLGMNVIVLDDLLEEFTEGVNKIFQMFSLFMALGLVVGVASLGVLAVRSVIERKQEIGIMRAIGYRKGMILGVFSTEMLFVTIMGILVGLGSGLVSGYGIWSTNMADFDVDFAIPWDNIVLVIAITLVAAVVCTFLPAWKASNTNPAEAVRWLE